MDVKVNSRLIKLEREKRAWTQEHLAKASGLAPRTIQRVERTGTASFESARALAAVLELSVADLRAGSSGTESNDSPPHRFLLALPVRLLLAIASGVACAIAVELPLVGIVGRLDFQYTGFALGGLLFATGVLWPHLKVGRGVAWRAIALVVISALSYFGAVSTVLTVPPDWVGAERHESLQSYVLASVVGASIVLLAARFLIPLRTTAAFWLLGLTASVLGGIGMYAGSKVLSTTLGIVGGFVSWHVVMCLALHFGGETNSVGRLISRLFVGRKATPRTPPSEQAFETGCLGTPAA